MSDKILLTNCRMADGKTINILIENDYISETGENVTADCTRYDCNGHLVMPGIIDVHTHIRDMGLAYKEDWLTASRAAAAGGITTVCDMPNTKPATFDTESLQTKRQAAKKSIVNYGYNFGVTEYNHDEIRKAAPVASIKMFMAESSSGYVVEREEVIREVFNVAKEIDKPVIVHSELQSCVEKHEKMYQAEISNHNKIRNRVCANEATKLLIKLAKETGAKVYIAHVSLREEIDMIRKAKQDGFKNIFCEITPHHLFINEDILNTAGNYGKVNPPLRTADDNLACEQAVIDGTADTIGTDHAPHGLEEKDRDYVEAPSGFPGLETSFGLMMQLVHQNKISLQRLEELMTLNPAKIFKIKQRGKIEVGFYADLLIADINKEWSVEPKAFFTKAKYSPFTGMSLRGKVNSTFVNGKRVFNYGKIIEIKGKEIEFA